MVDQCWSCKARGELPSKITISKASSDIESLLGIFTSPTYPAHTRHVGAFRGRIQEGLPLVLRYGDLRQVSMGCSCQGRNSIVFPSEHLPSSVASPTASEMRRYASGNRASDLNQ